MNCRIDSHCLWVRLICSFLVARVCVLFHKADRHVVLTWPTVAAPKTLWYLAQKLDCKKGIQVDFSGAAAQLEPINKFAVYNVLHTFH